MIKRFSCGFIASAVYIVKLPNYFRILSHSYNFCDCRLTLNRYFPAGFRLCNEFTVVEPLVVDGYRNTKSRVEPLMALLGSRGR